MVNNKKYTDEFKREVVNLVLSSEKSPKRIAVEMGISDNSIYKWLKDYDKSQPEGRTVADFQRLKKELADVKMERDILKKAVAIFSQQQK